MHTMCMHGGVRACMLMGRPASALVEGVRQQKGLGALRAAERHGAPAGGRGQHRHSRTGGRVGGKAVVCLHQQGVAAGDQHRHWH